MLTTVPPKKLTSKAMTFRLTEDARVILAGLAMRRGSDMTTYLEGLLRDEAIRQGTSAAELRGEQRTTPPADDR